MRYCLDYTQSKGEDPLVFKQTRIERTSYEETIALAGDAGSNERSTQVPDRAYWSKYVVPGIIPWS
jgi:hypothetical protein